MVRTKKAFCVMALALLVGAGSATRAEAIPIISLSAPASWNNGDAVAVDVVITALDEATGGIDIDVAFDDATLDGVDWSFGGAAFGDVTNGVDLSLGFAAGLVNLNFTSFEAVALLTGLQGPFPSGPLVLATINFLATDTGAGGFAIDRVNLSNNDGTALLPVCIAGDPCQVPEPGTLALFGAALAALGTRRLRRS